MIRFLLRRLVILFVRLFATAILLLVLIEFGFGMLGDSEDRPNVLGPGAEDQSPRHVWNMSLSDPVPPQLGEAGKGSGQVIAERLVVSGRSLLVALPSIWLIGYGWGLLGARYRGIRADLWLRIPFSLGAWLPSFWLVSLVAAYSYLVWERPGFAGELLVEEGPDLIVWWNALVVAFPLILAGASLQMKRVSDILLRASREVASIDLHLAGFRPDDIFHGHVWRRARRQLMGELDRCVPLALGGLLVTEWAFRLDGVGALLVDAIRLDHMPLVFLTAMHFAALVAFGYFVREIVVAWLGGPES